MTTATGAMTKAEEKTILALVNIHKVIRHMTKKQKVGSFFKLSKERKLTVSASTWKELAAILIDDKKAERTVAEMLAVLHKEEARKMLPGRLELIEAIPEVIEGLTELCFDRYKIHQNKYDLKMVELLTKRKKVWERIMELYPTIHVHGV